MWSCTCFFSCCFLWGGSFVTAVFLFLWVAVVKIRFGLVDKVTDLFLSWCINMKHSEDWSGGPDWEISFASSLSPQFKMTLGADEAQNSSCFSCFTTLRKAANSSVTLTFKNHIISQPQLSKLCITDIWARQVVPGYYSFISPCCFETWWKIEKFHNNERNKERGESELKLREPETASD